MRQAAFIYDESLSRHVLRQGHPMRPVRLRHTYELLQAYGAFDLENSHLFKPRPATEAEVEWVHRKEYIGAVRSLSLGLSGYLPERFGFSNDGDNPIYRGMYEASLLSAGASLVAAELIASGQAQVAFNISGGLHHAAAGHAAGFCIFNDPAIAIHHLLRRGFNRIAYIDIDVHHGDGVQAAFYDSKQVLTISLHESGAYLFPGSGFVSEIGTGEGIGYSVNVPLFPYTGDETYLWAFYEVVPPLLRAFDPQVIVTQLGIDTYYSDPLAHLQLTTQGFIEAVREFARMDKPWLALGGGGYDLSAVARCWTLAYGVMLGIDWPDQIPDVYAAEHQVKDLRDSGAPPIPPKVQQDTKRFAEETVSSIKQKVFPIHKLGGSSIHG